MSVWIRREMAALLRWLTRGEQLTGVGYTLALTGLLVGVLAPVVAATPLPTGLRAVGVIAFACVGPGAAVVCQLRVGDAVTAWATTLTLSLAIFAAVAVGMVWTDLWYPTAVFTALAWVSALGCLLGLAARGRPGDAVLPRQRGAVSTSPATDTTTVLPRIVEGRSDTAILPIVPKTSGSRSAREALTAVLPKIRDTVPAAPEPLDPAAAGAATRAAGAPPIDATAVIPRVVENRRPDETTRLPAVRAAASDQTMVLPAVPADGHYDGSGGTDQTVLIGAVADPAPAPKAARWAFDRWRLPVPAQVIFDVAVLGGIVAAWLLSVTLTSTAHVDSYGLLFVMHPTFFVAVVLCALGFVHELSRPQWRGWLLAVYIVLLVLVMHATVPLLVAEPEYAWVFKHLGVIDFIRTHGVVTNSQDIYQQWPTFFAAVAQVIAVSGVNPLRVAAWAPPFFDLANCLPVFAIARTLSTNRRLPYLAVFLFSCVNWIGQDYLSPQAFAYLLTLGCFMIMLRWLRRSPRRARLGFRPLRRLRNWVQYEMPEAPYTTARSRRLALFAVYLVYTIIVISHQISPYIVAASATALVFLGLVEAWQVVPILGGIAVSFLVTRYGAVDHYGIFNGFNFVHNAQGLHGNPSQAGQLFSAKVVRTLALSVWGATGLTLLAMRRRLGPVAVPGVLAFAPMVLLLAQSYGGEAIYRVYLFSVPWCACVMAIATLRIKVPVDARALAVRRALHAAKIAVATPLLVGAVLASMQGEHGQLIFDQFSRDEVVGAQYLYAHMESGAVLVQAQGNTPNSLTWRYAQVRLKDAGGAALFALPTEDGNAHEVDDTDLDAIDHYFSGFDGAPSYLVITTAMKHYADYFGYLPPGFLDRVGTRLSASPDWELWYSNAHVRIYKYQG